MTSKRIHLKDLSAARHQGQPFACLTAYDATMARLIEQAGADVILVGDSLGMVMQGHSTTLAVTVEDLCYHCECVARATQRVMIIADLPFLSDITVPEGLQHTKRLVQAGAQLVKVEASLRHVELVRALSACGIAVCAHLGVRPQWVHKTGMATARADDKHYLGKLQEEMNALVEAGADLLLFECIPTQLSNELVAASTVPVIGIGAGKDCDGQVLVTQDMLGMSESLPYFADNFLSAEHIDKNSIQAALAAYVKAVKTHRFPTAAHCR